MKYRRVPPYDGTDPLAKSRVGESIAKQKEIPMAARPHNPQQRSGEKLRCRMERAARLGGGGDEGLTRNEGGQPDDPKEEEVPREANRHIHQPAENEAGRDGHDDLLDPLWGGRA